MRRTAILVDDRDNRLGACTVADATRLIKYGDALYVRTERGVRLRGGGVGIVFEPTDPVVRYKLEPA